MLLPDGGAAVTFRCETTATKVNIKAMEHIVLARYAFCLLMASFSWVRLSVAHQSFFIEASIRYCFAALAPGFEAPVPADLRAQAR
jgi:hypothetical protein